jgi:hypothetical protein
MAIIAACSVRTENSTANLKDKLIGEWRNTYLKVTMNSAGGVADSVKVLEADSTNWNEKLGIKPIRTFFEADGTYHSDHYDLNDSLLFSATGKWSIINDTLIMDQNSPHKTSYRMKTSVDKSVARFHGNLDFDEDGEEDDEYTGWQRKF